MVAKDDKDKSADVQLSDEGSGNSADKSPVEIAVEASTINNPPVGNTGRNDQRQDLDEGDVNRDAKAAAKAEGDSMSVQVRQARILGTPTSGALDISHRMAGPSDGTNSDAEARKENPNL